MKRTTFYKTDIPSPSKVLLSHKTCDLATRASNAIVIVVIIVIVV